MRRRARRRLVGAIALALFAVVVLPLIFDPEPKPMGSNVDVRIPAQSAPFEAGPTTAPPQPVQNATPTTSVAPTVESIPASAPAATVVKSEPAPTVVPAEKQMPAEPARPEEKAKPEATSVSGDKVKPIEKAKLPAPAKSVERSKSPEPQKAVSAKPDVKANQGEQAYLLQLGSFSSEANAKLEVAKAREAGFKASVVIVAGQYKVRVGPLPDKSKAQEYQARLKAKGLASVLVEP